MIDEYLIETVWIHGMAFRIYKRGDEFSICHNRYDGVGIVATLEAAYNAIYHYVGQLVKKRRDEADSLESNLIFWREQ